MEKVLIRIARALERIADLKELELAALAEPSGASDVDDGVEDEPARYYLNGQPQ